MMILNIHFPQFLLISVSKLSIPLSQNLFCIDHCFKCSYQKSYIIYKIIQYHLKNHFSRTWCTWEVTLGKELVKGLVLRITTNKHRLVEKYLLTFSSIASSFK